MCFSYVYKHKFAAKLLKFFDTAKFFVILFYKMYLFLHNSAKNRTFAAKNSHYGHYQSPQ